MQHTHTHFPTPLLPSLSPSALHLRAARLASAYSVALPPLLGKRETFRTTTTTTTTTTAASLIDRSEKRRFARLAIYRNVATSRFDLFQRKVASGKIILSRAKSPPKQSGRNRSSRNASRPSSGSSSSKGESRSPSPPRSARGGSRQRKRGATSAKPGSVRSTKIKSVSKRDKAAAAKAKKARAKLAAANARAAAGRAFANAHFHASRGVIDVVARARSEAKAAALRDAALREAEERLDGDDLALAPPPRSRSRESPSVDFPVAHDDWTPAQIHLATLRWLQSRLQRKYVGAATLMAIMDRNRSGTVTFDEFQAGLVHFDIGDSLTKGEWRQLFRAIDVAADNELCVGDLRAAVFP